MKVFKMFATKGDYSEVSIDTPTYFKITGFEPRAAYTTGKNKAGEGVRVFNIGGTKIFTCYKKPEGEQEKGTNVITMLTADAVALGGRPASEVELERENEVALDF